MTWLRLAYWRFGRWAGWTSGELRVAFEAGMQLQRDLFERRIADLKARHARELTTCAARAEQRGQAEAIAVVEHLIDTTFPHLRDGRPN